MACGCSNYRTKTVAVLEHAIEPSTKNVMAGMQTPKKTQYAASTDNMTQEAAGKAAKKTEIKTTDR